MPHKTRRGRKNVAFFTTKPGGDDKTYIAEQNFEETIYREGDTK